MKLFLLVVSACMSAALVASQNITDYELCANTCPFSVFYPSPADCFEFTANQQTIANCVNSCAQAHYDVIDFAAANGLVDPCIAGFNCTVSDTCVLLQTYLGEQNFTADTPIPVVGINETCPVTCNDIGTNQFQECFEVCAAGFFGVSDCAEEFDAQENFADCVFNCANTYPADTALFAAAFGITEPCFLGSFTCDQLTMCTTVNGIGPDDPLPGPLGNCSYSCNDVVGGGGSGNETENEFNVCTSTCFDVFNGFNEASTCSEILIGEQSASDCLFACANTYPEEVVELAAGIGITDPCVVGTFTCDEASLCVFAQQVPGGDPNATTPSAQQFNCSYSCNDIAGTDVTAAPTAPTVPTSSPASEPFSLNDFAQTLLWRCTCPNQADVTALLPTCPSTTINTCQSIFNSNQGICQSALLAYDNSVGQCVRSSTTTGCDCAQEGLDFILDPAGQAVAPLAAEYLECLTDAGCTDLSGLFGNVNTTALLSAASCPDQLSFLTGISAAEINACPANLTCPDIGLPSFASRVQGLELLLTLSALLIAVFM